MQNEATISAEHLNVGFETKQNRNFDVPDAYSFFER